MDPATNLDDAIFYHTPSQRDCGEALSKFLVLFKAAKRGFWVFGLYDSVAKRDEVIETIKRLTTPMPSFDWKYAPDNPYPINYLKQLSDEQKQERAIISFLDLEFGQASNWKSLDFTRETFSSYPHSLIFWITANGHSVASRQAPHFWAQRSAVLDFTAPLPTEHSFQSGEHNGK